MKKNKSLLDIIIVGAGNGTNAVLGFLFFTMVARSLSLEDFGKYALLTSLLVGLSKIMDFGTNSIFVAKSIEKEEKLLEKFLSLRYFLFFLTLIIALGVLTYLNLLSPTVAVIFALGVFGYGINQTLFAYFQSLERFVAAVVVNMIPASIKAVMAGLIFFQIVSIDLTQAFAVFSISIIASVFLIPFLPKELRKLGTKANKKDVKDFFVESSSAGTSLLITHNWPAITNSLAKVAGAFTGVGIFSLANKISEIFSLVSLSVFTVLLPRNAKRKADQRGYDIKETSLISFGILLLAAGAIVIANAFTTKLFGAKFEESVGLLNILILASAFTAMHSFMENYFFVEKKTNILLRITVTRLVTLIILGLVLIPSLGLQGLAISMLIASILTLGITIKATSY